MPSKIIFSKEQISLISQFAKEGKTRSEISKILNVNRATITRAFKEFDISLLENSLNKKGKPYIWTNNKIIELKNMYLSKDFNLIDIANFFECSTKTIISKAKELNISKIESLEITQGDISYFRSNYNVKTIEEMAQDRRLKEYGVMKKLQKIGLLINKPVKYSNRNMPETQDFWNDYINPNMSHTDIGRKYGIDRTTIGKWRRKDFGKDFKVMINTWLHKSEPEILFEEILEELNMTFIYQKNICDYRCDYYLGFNIIVEINGCYWHSSEKAIERDSKKLSILKKSNYNVIVIWDNEIYNKEKIKKDILTQYRKAVMHNLPS